jgi:hypothetical protein
LQPTSIHRILPITNTDFEIAEVVNWDKGVIEMLEGSYSPFGTIETMLCLENTVSGVGELTVPDMAFDEFFIAPVVARELVFEVATPLVGKNGDALIFWVQQ